MAIKLNIESQLIYKDIQSHTDQLRDPRPRNDSDLFRSISLLIHKHLTEQYMPNILSYIFKEIKEFIKTKYCEGYDELYKELVYEFIQTKYLKVV